MRNPSRKARIFASLVALGLAFAWFGVEHHVPLGGDWVPGLMVVGGGLTAFACSLWLVQSLFHVRGMARLEAGIGLVARWHIGALDWEKYRAADSAREASDPQFLVNDLWVRKTTPPEGVEVIVGEKALIVDGSYHVLRIHGLPELRSIGWLDNSAAPGRPPDCLEFLLAYPRGRYGGIQYTCLRIPVPEVAQVPARKAYLQFAPALEARRAKGAIALRNPRRTLQVCGVMLAVSVVAAAWGWFEAERTGWSLNETMAPFVTLIVAAMAALFAVVLGGLTLLLRPKPTR
ncbi:MAG TPA: hypothetical protein VI168_19385 [Croceibacterium sp.]